MKYLLLLFFATISCGTPSPTHKTIIGPDQTEKNKPNEAAKQEEKESEIITTADVPIIETKAAATFNATTLSYFEIEKVDKNRGLSTLSFSNLPSIVVPNTYGGTLEAVELSGFENTIVVFKAIIKDTNFDKYYTYVYKNGRWKEVVNPFAIHKSHKNLADPPFAINASKPHTISRYYSVFDLDTEGGSGYTWRLLQESIPILNK